MEGSRPPSEVDDRLADIRRCRQCREALAHEPRPILAWAPGARIAIIGQAPGKKVHESGIPWRDASGKKLREWLNVADSEFYDPERFALIPMAFCYPGRGRSGDLPPRPECAPLWHDALLGSMPTRPLLLLVGRYSQDFYLRDSLHKKVTERVRHFDDALPEAFPLPHPSPRNRAWFSANPWFSARVLPALQKLIARRLAMTAERV